MTTIDEEKLPEKIKRRIALAKIFYPLDRKEERKWGNIFDSSWESIYNEFLELAHGRDYIQEPVGERTILWYDAKNKTGECMFCFIDDITDFDSVFNIFKKIKKYHPLFSNAIVHQRKEGEGVYDIFRFSKFSYLEHCNRVRSPRRKTV